MRLLARYSIHGDKWRPLAEAALKAAKLKPSQESQSSVRELYYDTFDWRLFKEGLHCRRKGDVFELSSVDGSGPHLHARPRRPSRARFAKDFPQGKFRDSLEEICEIRALIEVCSVVRKAAEFKILDSHDKTIGKIRIERIRADGESSEELLSLLELHQLKGYEEEIAPLKEALDAGGLPPLGSGHSVLSLALGAAGRTPDDYSSSFEPPVFRGMSCRAAAVAILSKLMETMGRNLGGVVNDTDMEFLHDYRVSIRRIRSALSQIKGVFPDSDVLRFKRDFGHIGRLTNRLRDLDVLLLSRQDCEDSVPEELRPGLRAFFASLDGFRSAEFKRLSSELSAQTRFKTVKRWQDYLDSAKKLPPMRNSEITVESLAGSFILKRLKRVLKAADKLDEDSPDSEMHSLRIECKKLRYLLEFFGPLYESRGVSKIVGRLKGIQDFLGGLNDLSVQQRLLASSLSTLPRKGSKSILAAAALGALIAKLCERREKLKRNFSKVFSKFLDSSEFDELAKSFASKGR